MVLDLGFLGDTIHLLPALWMIRRAYPEAELHVAVAAHITSLIDCVPWVNRVWGYMRYPRHATLRENLQMISKLRRERFDVVINLNGSDRSSWLTFLSGARERLGRVPDGGGPPFWRRMFTAHVSYPFDNDPVYVQRCRCLEEAGFPSVPPEFHVAIPAENLRAAKISETDAGSYFHVSPFTTADYKELSPTQLAELLMALEKKFPAKRLVLSCAPTDRETKKMAELLDLLQHPPWRVFGGHLDLRQLAAVIQHSAAHFCGDTGTLHMALMTNTPSVTWFWPNPNMRVWIPASDLHQTVVGANATSCSYLQNVTVSGILNSLEKALRCKDAGISLN